MPMFYTPKPRQFRYQPRFYDPEKEKWEALKAKYALERELAEREENPENLEHSEYSEYSENSETADKEQRWTVRKSARG